MLCVCHKLTGNCRISASICDRVLQENCGSIACGTCWFFSPSALSAAIAIQPECAEDQPASGLFKMDSRFNLGSILVQSLFKHGQEDSQIKPGSILSGVAAECCSSQGAHPRSAICKVSDEPAFRLDRDRSQCGEYRDISTRQWHSSTSNLPAQPAWHRRLGADRL